jgi:predicted glycogen debranching enzyme
MSYIKFEKEKLVNLEYALSKELLRSNRAGSYAGTSLNGCNTRKYHGLLVCPINEIPHVLLSSVDETIIQHGKQFRLGIHKYEGNVFFPHGHRYITSFESEPIPSRTYSIGGVVLKKEILLVHDEERILLRYTILDAHSATILRLNPFLAFRNIHSLSKANMDVNTKVIPVNNGIKHKMYDNFPYLYMQISKKSNFISAPDWNYNNEYEEEKKRGFEFKEDLFVPGFFDINVKKGEQIIFSAGLTEIDSKQLTEKFEREIENRIPRNNFENNLINSAQQFFIKNKSGKFISAGYYWYSFKFRESLWALPGLTVSIGKPEKFVEVFDDYIKLFNQTQEIIPIDIPLLIIRNMQLFNSFSKSCEEINEKFGDFIFDLYNRIKSGQFYAHISENGLLYIPDEYKNLTWMNEEIDGVAVTPRSGYVSEVNALWYNALLYLRGFAEMTDKPKIAKEIKSIVEKVKHFYTEVFYNEKEECLYDFVNQYEKNEDIRPNQIFAVSLPYSPLEKDIQKKIIKKVKIHLLTDRGLRTLSPQSSKYIGEYSGNESQRSNAKHQGTVHPWLIANFAEAWINIYSLAGLNFVEEIYLKFEETINEHGIGSISEFFDGDSPHSHGGAVSYAPSVGELLRTKALIDYFKKETN